MRKLALRLQEGYCVSERQAVNAAIKGRVTKAILEWVGCSSPLTCSPGGLSGSDVTLKLESMSAFREQSWR